MLSGNAVVAIWNDITGSGRDAFYAWHLQEHMPERTAIPGFRRGRRYIAIDTATVPEFFTLYEADDLHVLQGSDYLARLNAPTPWTRQVTAEFRNTARALARVRASAGPGSGGVALTVRFSASAASADALAEVVRSTADRPRVTGAHLCTADDDASGRRTAESQGRTDLQAPPEWFAIVEATDAIAVADALRDADLHAAGATGAPARGVYRLEYTRTATADAAG